MTAMKNRFNSVLRSISVATVVSAALCSGCLSLSPRKAYIVEFEDAFVSNAAQPALSSGAKDRLPALRIGAFAAAEPYGTQRMLVWEEKTGRLHGTKHAELSTRPAVALRNSVRRMVAASGRYAEVVDSDMPSSREGPLLSGYVERSRLEKRSDGSFVYVLSATFRYRASPSTPVRSFVLKSEKTAPGAKPWQQAFAARAAYADVATRLATRLSAFSDGG